MQQQLKLRAAHDVATQRLLCQLRQVQDFVELQQSLVVEQRALIGKLPKRQVSKHGLIVERINWLEQEMQTRASQIESTNLTDRGPSLEIS